MMTAAELFGRALPRLLQEAPQRAQAVGGSFLFVLSGELGGTWRVDLERSPPEVSGEPAPARCTIEAEVHDFEAMLERPVIALQLYREGRLRVSGDRALAARFHLLLSD